MCIIERVEDYNKGVMKKLEKYLYFFYYSLYKFWTFVSAGNELAFFQADVSIIALSFWFIGSIINFMNAWFHYNFYNDIDIRYIGFFVIIISLYNLYFVDNSKKINYYFRYFDNLPRTKKVLCHLYTWIIILSIIISFWSTLKWMRI